MYSAHAAEYYTPMQPGVSTGAPAGALPPPGIYGNVDTYFLSGRVKDGSGNNVPNVKLNGADITGQILYVPGWHFLGASYAMRFVQPFNLNTIKVSGGPGANSITGYGMFNTVLTPEMLSWNLGAGNFIGEGLSIYLKDGDFRHTTYTGAQPKAGYIVGQQMESSDSIANNFWTFEPNVAYSYLAGGWNITLNNTFDFNTKDTTTNYQSGDIYYLDYTVAHSFGPMTFGVIGNYVQQFTADSVNGATVPAMGGSNSYGNEYMHASVGPIFAYNIGKATVTFRYLYGFAGKNGGNPSFFHFGVSFPIM